MYLKRMSSTDDIREAMAIYACSFPAHEQRENASQREILQNPAYSFLCLMEGSTQAGILLCWETDAFIYVEHFAVKPEARGQGYGQRALQLLLSKGKTVILEIDPPVDETSLRRLGFYTRCGFVKNSFAHRHPAYHAGTPAHALTILSAPRALTQAEYDAFNLYLTDTVMKNALTKM